MLQIAARKDAQAAVLVLEHLNAACHQSEREQVACRAACAREKDTCEQMRQESGRMQAMLAAAAKCALDLRDIMGECAAGWQEESAAALAEMTRLREAGAVVQQEMVLQEARVDKARRVVESMQDERCTLQEALATMKGEEEELRRTQDSIRESIQRLQNEEQVLVGQVALLCEREQRQEEANGHLKLLLVAQQSQYAHLSREIRGLEDARSAEQAQLESLQEQAARAREQSLLFESRVASLRKELRSETFRVRTHLRQLPQHPHEHIPDAPAPSVPEVANSGAEYSGLDPGAEAGGGGGTQGGDTLNMSELSHVSHPDERSVLACNTSTGRVALGGCNASQRREALHAELNQLLLNR